MSKYEDLVAKLREIFQIDRPDLDFGVYRVLNARADEINEYLSKRLKERVAEALTAGATDNAKAIKTALAKAEKGAEDAGIDPADSPKVKQLKADLAAASTGATEHENQVFSHLLTFFSRYYDKGDFISQRRYKGDTYAIPYSGEEVVLHWANRDQYYIKSGESFSNYSFKLDDGRSVHFRLVAADTAKDNRKDNDKERRFMLADARIITRLDDDGEPFEEAIAPVSEENGELIIRFDYATAPKGTKQDKLVEEAVAAVLADDAAKTKWVDLAKRAPTEKKPQRTLLEKHLTTYTQKNTADYFIHKDLGPFLRRELDFYIKNEVMHLDDVQNAEAFAAIEKNLRMIQCLRAIAQDLITFLASIEDFQKKLWLKRKFVVAAEYCVTLDRVPEALYPAIAANTAQWAQWHDLGMRESADAGTVDDLKAQPFLMVDTNLFDAAFRADLLRALPDLDAKTDGLLVHGDNFHALTLLRERYRQQVECVYIDPPYNTGDDGFAYKDAYKHASWMTMMDNRIKSIKPLMTEAGLFSTSIDRDENRNLLPLLFSIFGENNFLEEVVWKKSYGGGAKTKHINNLHEYVHQFSMDKTKVPYLALPPDPDVVKYYKLKDRKSDIRGKHRLQPLNTNSNDFRKDLTYPIPIPDLKLLGKKEWEKAAEEIAGLLRDENLVLSGSYEDGWELVYSDGKTWDGNALNPPRQWQWSWKKLRDALIEDEVVITETDALISASYKQYRYDEEGKERGQKPSSVQIGPYTQSGTAAVRHLFGYDAAKFPKPVGLVKNIVGIGYPNKSSMVADFFAGSGTTGEAVLDLNRFDDGDRKLLLADQGDSFDTVLKPRMQKVVYSADWKDGKPTSSETGIGYAFKTLKIESYEDALNNLTFTRTDGQQNLLDGFKPEAKDDYLMRYMLDVESKGSLLSVDDFQKPFDYSLKIAVDSAGAFETRKVDLVETFSYLIGLRASTVNLQLDKGYALVTGSLPSGERAMVVWRDCDVIGYEALKALFDELGLVPGQEDYDLIYVNGDHNVPDVLVSKVGGADVTEKMALRRIEPVFLDAMFNVDDV